MRSRALVPVAAAVVTAGLVAVAIALFAQPWLRSTVRVVACYDSAVIAMLIWYWRLVLLANPAKTKALASEEDPGRNTAFGITLVAVIFGFVAAFDVLGHGPHNLMAQRETAVDVLGFGAVALGWLLIHTVFIFRYAHLYYRDHDRNKESDRGLNFPGDAEPDYMDFAYFSLVVGMTFQVSDVQVTSRNIRAFVLFQGLIAFGYYTSLVALVVNLVSGLLH
ncbi:MAG TPA: DUF1345 domain-containing protein [Candidatus Dormibacteraeota bacterium]|nr:DUF1345 domain-containing protein [Candidatus Dormibacteraeota bacterium]